MKKSKTLVGLSLCAAMAMSTFAGCQNGNAVASSTPSQAPAASSQSSSAPSDFPTAASKDGKYDPGIKLTTVRGISDIMQSRGLDVDPDIMSDNLWYRDFKDILGIEVVNQWSVPGAQYKEKMNAQIAANDLPDFYSVDASQLKMVVDYGMAADLTEVFKEHACDFTNEMMEADNHVGLGQATTDGKLMALPNVNGNRDGANFFWVRKDWMDNLKIEEPKTMDEFIEMCRRFVTDDPDGNGKNDTNGFGLSKDLFGGFMGLNPFGESFHAYLDTDSWVEVNGKIEYGSIQPEAKTVLEALAKMYKDGLIDKEFIVKDGSKVSEEVVAGKVGAFGGQHANAFWPLQDVRTNNPEAMFVALPIVSNDGVKPKTMVNGSALNFFVVNSKCANPEAVVKMYNYFYLKDPALSPEFDEKYHGKVDSEKDWPADQAYWWSPVNSFYPMQNLFIHTSVEDYFDKGDKSALENYWVSDNISQNQRFIDGDNTVFGTYIWSGAGDYSAQGRVHYYDQNDMFVLNAYTGPNTDAQVQFKTTLDQLRLETFTKIIMGEAPISEFDNFVTQWKALGGDQITEQINASR